MPKKKKLHNLDLNKGLKYVNMILLLDLNSSIIPITKYFLSFPLINSFITNLIILLVP